MCRKIGLLLFGAVAMVLSGCGPAIIETESVEQRLSTSTSDPGTVTQPTPEFTLLPSSSATPRGPLSGAGGGRITFASKRTGNYEIYVMNADGSDLRQLTHNSAEDSDPMYSPDGKKVAFPSDRSGRFEIYVMGADGSDLRRLTTKGGWGPTWSPDSSRIAFSREEDLGSLYVMNSEGSGHIRVSGMPEGMNFYGFDWSPDGSAIALAAEPASESDGFLFRNSSIQIAHIEEIDGETRVVELFQLPKAGENVNDWPRWSPDGSRIMFSAHVGRHRDLFLIDSDGTNLVNLTNSPTYDEYGSTWSPDGTRVAFQSSKDGGWDIYTMNLDGTGLMRLTSDPENDVAPSWVP